MIRARRTFFASLAAATAAILLAALLPSVSYAAPAITSISPQPTWSGANLTIKGSGFGATRGSNYAVIGEIEVEQSSQYSKWSDTEVICKVPGGAEDTNVYVRVGGVNSNTKPLDLNPHVNSLSPPSASPDTIVTVTGGSFGYWEMADTKVFLGEQEIDTGSFGYVTNKSDTSFQIRIASWMQSGNLKVTNDMGQSNNKYLTIDHSTVGGSNQYLAEGSNKWGFETVIEAFVGPGTPTSVAYMTTDGLVERPDVSVETTRKVTINTNAEVPDKDFSTWFHHDDPERYMAVNRMMYWNGRLEGTLSGGLKEPKTTWYLAEGCTDYGFETFVLLQNPNTETANVNVTYMTPEGSIDRAPFQVAPSSRTTLSLNSEIPGKNVSTRVISDKPIMVERAMYWDGRRGGHASIGTDAPANDFYLAEGTTAYGFDEWVLVQNPNNEQITLDVTYMTYGGPISRPQAIMPPNSRATIHVNDEILGDISVKVRGSKPIVAERAMYWNNGTGKAGHATIGTSAPDYYYGFGSGHTESPYETFLLVQNVGSENISVQVYFYGEGGQLGQFTFGLPPQSRGTVNAADHYPGQPLAMTVAQKTGSSWAIIAEQAIYWNGRTGGGDTLGWPGSSYFTGSSGAGKDSSVIPAIDPETLRPVE